MSSLETTERHRLMLLRAAIAFFQSVSEDNIAVDSREAYRKLRTTYNTVTDEIITENELIGHLGHTHRSLGHGWGYECT